ncbi:MAG: hypothetical protein RKE49_13880 [Oceanicaulis sp.]
MDPDFLSALGALAPGYHNGLYDGERWGVTVTGGPGDSVRKLYAERLAGGKHVSFNLYALASGPLLKPCEMPETKVVDFVLGFSPDAL